MHDRLSEARQHRAGLRDAVGAVERALAAPAGERADRWSKELAHELDELGDALERHIAATEAEGGLLDDIVQQEPRLARRAYLVREDHLLLRRRLDEARAVLPSEPDDVATARDRSVALLEAIIRHRHLGSDLVYDAFNVDMEAGD
jgi:hypothetical protein